MTSFASSASPELVHWHDEKPIHLLSGQILTRAQKAANDALFHVNELFVTAEHTMEDICTHLEIADFSHHLANKNLVGAKLILSTDGTLSIIRPDQMYHTTFQVQRNLLAA